MTKMKDILLGATKLLGKTEEELSPSGRFKLVIDYYATTPGCWNYSRGRVYRISDGNLIADIKRNYSVFHHSFVVKNGQEYLISGRSYMNQCIVNLDKGKEIEVSDEALMKMGTAFCWAAAVLSPDGNTLVVDGCHWACPYEYKFFDFSDPSKGWPELEIISKEEYEKHKDNLEDAATTYIAQDQKAPEFNEDGTITAYETEAIYIPTGQRDDDISLEETEKLGEAYDDESNWKREVEVVYTLRRKSNYLVVENEWQSVWKQDQNRQRKEYDEKLKAQRRKWMDTDPIYIALEHRLQGDPDLEFGGMWWCGSSVKDREEGEKNVWFFYPYIKSKHQKKSAHLKWGTIEGPIRAELWVRGKGQHEETFERSEKGLQEALEAIRGHLHEPRN